MNIPVFYFSLEKIEIWIDAHQKENVSQHYNPTVSNMNSCILGLKIFFINFQLIKLHFASYVVVVVVRTYSFNKQ